MSNRFNDQFHAGQRAEEIVRKAAKRFSVRVEVSPWAKTHIVVEEATKALLKGFKDNHDPKLEARGIKIELLCESYDTVFDVAQFFSKAYEIKNILEKRGFKRAFFHVEGRKSEIPALNFTVSFWDVDPRDPFTGTPYYELLRTEGF